MGGGRGAVSNGGGTADDSIPPVPPSAASGAEAGDLSPAQHQLQLQAQMNARAAEQWQNQQQMLFAMQHNAQQSGAMTAGWPRGFIAPGFFPQAGMGAMPGMIPTMPGMPMQQGMGGHGGGGQEAASQKMGASDMRGVDGESAKGRKVPKRSAAATVERMEKHKILERRRRERTKELIAQLFEMVPGINKIGESPTMNSVLEEAIVYLKDNQWETLQRRSYDCKCGAVGYGKNPMPDKPAHIIATPVIAGGIKDDLSDKELPAVEGSASTST